eukprot:126988-Rhodomonas_salina.2
MDTLCNVSQQRVAWQRDKDSTGDKRGSSREHRRKQRKSVAEERTTSQFLRAITNPCFQYTS